MSLMESGRSGAMIKEYKDENVKDLMREYFNHPVWKMKWGDPVPHMPLDIQIEPVNTCNCFCTACNYTKQERKTSFLEWPVLEKIVYEAAQEGVAYFTICGIGEAGLHPDLFRLLGMIRSQNVKPKGLRKFNKMLSVLVSNCKWDEKQVIECIENPPDLLSVSLAGLTDEDITDRRKGINIDELRKNISAIYNNRKVIRGIDNGISPAIHISTHIYPYEIENRAGDIKKFKQEWFEISDAIVIKPTIIDPVTKNTKLFTDNYNPVVNKNLQYRNISQSGYKRTAPCFETSRRLSVNSDGDVWCGHFLSERFGKYLGNVKNQSIREIWHSKEMNDFRLQVRSGIFERPSCQSCGGEIREENRDTNGEIEVKLNFTSEDIY